MAWNPQMIGQAAGIAGYKQPDMPELQPYQTSNPVALSANDARRAWANANGMRERAEAVENAPGGSMAAKPQQEATMSNIAALGEPSTDKPQAAPPQAQGMGSLGSAIGAVANFYTGNYAGMAQSLSNMGAQTSTDPASLHAQGSARGEVSKPADGQQAVSGLLGGLFGGGDKDKSKSGGGMDSNMLSGIMSMFGGG